MPNRPDNGIIPVDYVQRAMDNVALQRAARSKLQHLKDAQTAHNSSLASLYATHPSSVELEAAAVSYTRQLQAAIALAEQEVSR